MTNSFAHGHAYVGRLPSLHMLWSHYIAAGVHINELLHLLMGVEGECLVFAIALVWGWGWVQGGFCRFFCCRYVG